MNKKAGFLATFIIDSIAFLLFIVIAIIFFFLLKVTAASEITAAIEGKYQQATTTYLLLGMLRTPIPDELIPQLTPLVPLFERHTDIWQGKTYGEFLDRLYTLNPSLRKLLATALTKALFEDTLFYPTQLKIKYPDKQIIQIEMVAGVIVTDPERIVNMKIPLSDGNIAEVSLYEQ